MSEQHRNLVQQVLAEDPACNGRVTSETAAALGDALALAALSPVAAIGRGREIELADVLAFLRGRLRMAEAVAAANPVEADYARALMRQIEVEIDALANGLHEGAAAKEALLAPVVPDSAEAAANALGASEAEEEAQPRVEHGATGGGPAVAERSEAEPDPDAVAERSEAEPDQNPIPSGAAE